MEQRSQPVTTEKAPWLPWPPVPWDEIPRESGALPRGHWLWPTNLLDALAGWYDRRLQARYAKKGY